MVGRLSSKPFHLPDDDVEKVTLLEKVVNAQNLISIDNVKGEGLETTSIKEQSQLETTSQSGRTEGLGY